MVIAGLIVLYHTLLDTFGSNGKRDMYQTVPAALSCKDSKLHSSQCGTRITI